MDVLQDSETNGGLRNYFLCVKKQIRSCRKLMNHGLRSFGFSGECLGQHDGSDQAANLGDGNGYSA